MMLESKLQTAADIQPVVGPAGSAGAPGAEGGALSVNGLTGDVVLGVTAGVFPISNDEPSTNDLNEFRTAGVYSSSGTPPIRLAQ